MQRFGFRAVELVVGSLVAAIGISYLVELLIARSTGERAPRAGDAHRVRVLNREGRVVREGKVASEPAALICALGLDLGSLGRGNGCMPQ